MSPLFCSTALSLVVNDAENLEKYADHDPPARTRRAQWAKGDKAGGGVEHRIRIAPQRLTVCLLSLAAALPRLSMCVLIYLRLDRPDLASKSLKAMQDLDDDDTLTQLASAWAGIYAGGEKLTEAAFLLQELLEKFGPSVVVLNSLAVCDIHQRNYTNAFQYTKQARELSIKSGARVAAETLLNSIVCLQHLRRGQEIVDKIEAELKLNYPNHPWIQKQADMKAMFDKHAVAFKAK